MNTETNIQNLIGVPTTFDQLFSERLGPSKLIAQRVRAHCTREHIQLRVQETLDELSSERLIPITLTAYKVNADDPGAYTILFRDHRINSISFFWKIDETFKEAVRVAIVNGIRIMSGPHERLVA